MNCYREKPVLFSSYWIKKLEVFERAHQVFGEMPVRI
jgi:hypothetical protein